jgi:hypothetical protein
MTGSLSAEIPGSSKHSYITVGNSTDTNINPTIKFNPSVDNQYKIMRKKLEGFVSFYNCTVMSATSYKWYFGGLQTWDTLSDVVMVNTDFINYTLDYYSLMNGSTIRMTNCTFNSDIPFKEGIYGNLIAYSCIFSNSDKKAFSTDPYHNSTFVNCDFFASGSYQNGCVHNQAMVLKYANCSIYSTGRAALLIETYDKSTSYVRDCELLNSYVGYPALSYDARLATKPATLEVVNTYYDGRDDYCYKSNTINRSWYLDVLVEDQHGTPVSDATVSVTSPDGGEVNIGYATNTWQWAFSAYTNQISGIDGHTPLPSTGNSLLSGIIVKCRGLLIIIRILLL